MTELMMVSSTGEGLAGTVNNWVVTLGKVITALIILITIIVMAKKFFDIRKGQGTSTIKDVIVTGVIGVLAAVLVGVVVGVASPTGDKGWLFNLFNGIFKKGGTANKVLGNIVNDLNK